MSYFAAEKPEPRRRWRGWAILEPDEKFYRITLDDPAENEPIQGMLKLGWFVIPVEIIEFGKGET